MWHTGRVRRSDRVHEKREPKLPFLFYPLARRGVGSKLEYQVREGVRYSMTSNVSVDSSGETMPSAVFARTVTL